MDLSYLSVSIEVFSNSNTSENRYEISSSLSAGKSWIHPPRLWSSRCIYDIGLKLRNNTEDSILSIYLYLVNLPIMGPSLTDSSYKVRRFEREDLQRIMQINFECLPENYSSYFYLRLFEKHPETFLVADTSDKVQGYIMCRIERGWSKIGSLMPVRLSHIVSIAVVENYRRQGIATSLVLEAMKKGRDLYSATEGYLEVRVSNEPAINLYKKLGFDQVKRNYGYYMDGEDAWVMAANLKCF